MVFVTSISLAVAVQSLTLYKDYKYLRSTETGHLLKVGP